MANHSIRQIISDYRQNIFEEEIVGDWGSVVFYRLPAFFVARTALLFGISATALTVSGAIVLPLIALLAWALPLTLALPSVALLSILFNVIDCADGTVARANQTTSRSGAYLDFACDIFHRNVMLATIGYITDQLYPSAIPIWFAVGLLCGLCATYTRLNRDYTKHLRSNSNLPSTHHRSWLILLYRFLSGLDTLLPVLALFAWWFSILPELLIWLIIYTSLDAIIAVAENYIFLKKLDNQEKSQL